MKSSHKWENNMTENSLLIVPNELFVLTLELLDIASIFSLSRTSAKYSQHKSIRLFLFGTDITTIKLDAIIDGHSSLVKWLISASMTRSDKTSDFCYYAIKYGRLEILKYLHENDFPFEYGYGPDATAARNGQLEILKWLHENGYNIGILTLETAAANGHIEIVKWVHERGCYVSQWALIAAVDHGSIEVVKYLYQNGCRLSEMSYNTAVRSGNLEMLKYLHTNNCPWDKVAWEIAEEN